MKGQQFGGPWTDRKLRALEKYLEAYLTIFTTHPVAKKFTRHYVDAFAGSGLRTVSRDIDLPLDLNGSSDVGEALAYMDGSVRKVLSMEKDFHRYWFVEKDPSHARTLDNMIDYEYSNRRSQSSVFRGDANDWLPSWCDSLEIMDRAVVFLDPFGMDVKWATIEKLAQTEKVDLWMLFPSLAVIRMLPREGPPNEAWESRLNEFFGDNKWREEFYSEVVDNDLFGERKGYSRKVNTETVSNYLLRRLNKVFAKVVDKPLILRNSRNSTLFMLVFAAGNKRGAGPAVSIAGNIIDNT